MEYIKSVTVDINAENNYAIIPVKQGDSINRKIRVSITSNGSTASITGVSEALFRVQKPDGHAVIQSSKDTTNPITSSGNVYTIPLAKQALVAAGRALCDLALLDSSGNVLSSCTFVLDIIPSPDVSDPIESSDSWQRMMEAIETAESIGGHIAFRESADSTKIQYTTDNGTTWKDLCPVSDIVQSITSEQIDALFAS